MKKLNQKGFGAIEIILVLVIVGILGAVGWFLWPGHQSDSQINSQNDSQSSTGSFAECKADKDSKLQESYPEVCVTKDGQRFTNPDQHVEPPPN